MASLRAFGLALALLFFFVAVAPLQWVLARRGSRFATWIPLLFCRSLLRILRVSVDVKGERALRPPVLLAVNHVSWIDILALGGLTPFCFLAKREVGSWPIVSAFAKVQGTVFVDRKRRRSIPPANRQMAARMLEGRTVLLFPEGTTLGDPMPGPFYSSHFAAARDLLHVSGDQDVVSVQPVALMYSSDVAPWVGEEALLPHLWRVLRATPMQCTVMFGAPIAYRRESDRKVVARLARSRICDLLIEARSSARPGQASPAEVASMTRQPPASGEVFETI